VVDADVEGRPHHVATLLDAAARQLGARRVPALVVAHAAERHHAERQIRLAKPPILHRLLLTTPLDAIRNNLLDHLREQHTPGSFQDRIASLQRELDPVLQGDREIGSFVGSRYLRQCSTRYGARRGSNPQKSCPPDLSISCKNLGR